ncbi:unnamed protein product [Echinostoma caproni]|uniref:Uncharacterized protein n=1 Tax=Echinostoma caproni TaxID=27848 RepID=A0A183BA43_9TREM|nr:unnamed protein product [Echinostoma caproni]
MLVECRLKPILSCLPLGDSGLDTHTKRLSYMQGQAARLNLDKNIFRLSSLQGPSKSFYSILLDFGQRIRMGMCRPIVGPIHHTASAITALLGQR